jgi:hypothetical protein
VIEAGATAASKWWSTGLGVSVAALWASIAGWWDGQNTATQRVALWGAAIVTGAAVFGIAYLLGSDVRGRGTAAAATIRARAELADVFIRAAQAVYVPSQPSSSIELIALPAPLQVSYTTRPSADEPGWYAIALRSNGADETKYLVAKGAAHAWADASEITFLPPAVALPPGHGG